VGRAQAALANPPPRDAAFWLGRPLDRWIGSRWQVRWKAVACSRSHSAPAPNRFGCHRSMAACRLIMPRRLEEAWGACPMPRLRAWSVAGCWDPRAWEALPLGAQVSIKLGSARPDRFRDRPRMLHFRRCPSLNTWPSGPIQRAQTALARTASPGIAFTRNPCWLLLACLVMVCPSPYPEPLRGWGALAYSLTTVCSCCSPWKGTTRHGGRAIAWELHACWDWRRSSPSGSGIPHRWLNRSVLPVMALMPMFVAWSLLRLVGYLAEEPGSRPGAMGAVARLSAAGGSPPACC